MILKKTIIGMGVYLIGMVFCVILNAMMKKTINTFHLPVYEVLFVRQLCIVVFLLPLMIKRKFNFFDKKTLKPNLIRNVLFSFATGIMYIGISKIPLNDSTAISFLTPILGSLFAVKFLGEKSSKSIWIALFLSVIGMLIIKKPSFDDDSDLLLGYGILLIAVIIRGYIVVLNKKLSQQFDTMTILFYTHIILLLFSGCFCWQFVPFDINGLKYMLFLGFLFLVEYYFVFKAYKYSPAVLLQPLDFSRLIFMMLFSSIFMNESTTFKQIIGGLVILSGYLVMIIEKNIKIKR